jgi:hypothetical protein
MLFLAHRRYSIRSHGAAPGAGNASTAATTSGWPGAYKMFSSGVG